ncbi:MAG: CBS domain-containing protein, partial [Terrimicrobiaceae bacterium]|nr:CBS domain-containing protein [Terrimicrobiaceae bacterium]
MTEQVEVVAPEAPICEAARLMRSLDVGILPVCDGERLVGMLTDRDLVIRAMAEASDPRHTLVQEVMTPGIVYCFEDED